MFRILITMKLALFLSASMQAQHIDGSWQGTLKAGTNEIGFVFDIETVDGNLAATMSIPGRNLRNLKAKATTFEDGELLIDGSNYGWEYRGTFNEENSTFEGKFKEGVNQLPLNLAKAEAGAKEEVRVKRPQEPEMPLPYQAEEVVFKNEKAGIQLAGTLTLPSGVENPPVAILITGSGPQNRDQEIFGHKPFLVLSDYLTRNGIAVLRYDDRGVNGSTGDFSGATTADFATDAMAAVNYLKTRDDVNLNQIGLIGHSEGGIVAPLVIAEIPRNIAFFVNLAGTGLSGYETSLQQALHGAKGKVPDIKAYEEFMRGVLDIASAKEDIEVVREKLAAHYMSSDFFHGSIPEGADKQTILNSLIDVRTNPWTRYFYNYTPADVYKKVKCPVLSLNGTKDTQVFAKPNQEAIREALKKARNKDYTIMEIEGQNHFFQQVETGESSEYSEIEETFSPKTMEIIKNWILERIAKG